MVRIVLLTLMLALLSSVIGYVSTFDWDLGPTPTYVPETYFPTYDPHKPTSTPWPTATPKPTHEPIPTWTPVVYPPPATEMAPKSETADPEPENVKAATGGINKVIEQVKTIIRKISRWLSKFIYFYM